MMLGSRIQCFKFKDPGSGFRVLGTRIQVSGFRFQSSDFWIRVSSFEIDNQAAFMVSRIEDRTPCDWCREQGSSRTRICQEVFVLCIRKGLHDTSLTIQQRGEHETVFKAV
jgi:hypothetical protein